MDATTKAAHSLGLTAVEGRALDWAAHIHRTLDGAATATGRQIRRSTMKRLERLGLVVETLAYMVDDDGFLRQPERERFCFALTAAGHAAAAKMRAALDAALATDGDEETERGTK